MKKIFITAILSFSILLAGCSYFQSPGGIGFVTQQLLNVLSWNCQSANTDDNFLNSGYVGNVVCSFIPAPSVAAPLDFESRATILISEALDEACRNQTLVTAELNTTLKVAVTLLCGTRDGVPSFTRGVIIIGPIGDS